MAPMSSAPSSPRPSSRSLIIRLQQEWDRVSRSPRSIRRAQAWGWRFEHVESLDEILAMTGYSRTPVDRAAARLIDGDEVLGLLVELARTDELAGRLLLQRLLPGMCTTARRRSRNPWDLDAALDEVVATAWSTIRNYSVDRKPHFIVPNMLRDIEYRAFVQPGRRRATFIPQPGHTFDRTASPPTVLSAAEELAELLDIAERSGIDSADLDLARRLASGQSTAELAVECRVTDRTIRNRRDTVTYRLRQVALACA